MPKRTKTGQAKHDKAVLRSADWYKKRGYSVKADVPGWDKPKTIGGRRPDLIVKKGKKEIVKEIETKDSNKKDLKQHKAFSQYAARKKTRDFQKKII